MIGLNTTPYIKGETAILLLMIILSYILINLKQLHSVALFCQSQVYILDILDIRNYYWNARKL